jgi:hypothetical protein
MRRPQTTTKQTTSNPFRMIFFAYLHTLNPMVSYSYKKVGGVGSRAKHPGTDFQPATPLAPSAVPTAMRRLVTSRREEPPPSTGAGIGSRETDRGSLLLRSALWPLCPLRKIHMHHLHPPGREAKQRTRPVEGLAFDFQLSTVDLPLTTRHPLLTLVPQQFFGSPPRR